MRTLEEGWPIQRLRIAFALILFYFFETMIGKQMGFAIAIIALGLGIASLVSAMQAIKEWQDNARIHLIQEAINEAHHKRLL
jgi:hypothetical protein